MKSERDYSLTENKILDSTLELREGNLLCLLHSRPSVRSSNVFDLQRIQQKAHPYRFSAVHQNSFDDTIRAHNKRLAQSARNETASFLSLCFRASARKCSVAEPFYEQRVTFNTRETTARGLKGGAKIGVRETRLYLESSIHRAMEYATIGAQ